MPYQLSDSLLEAFTRKGARLRSLLLATNDSFSEAQSAAEHIAEKSLRKLHRLPSHLDIYELDDYIRSFRAADSVYFLPRVASKAYEFIARLLAEIERQNGIVIMTCDVDELVIFSRFAGRLDVIVNEFAGNTEELRGFSELQHLVASSSVDEVIEVMRRSGSSEKEMMSFVLLPQAILRNVLHKNNTSRSAGEEPTKRNASSVSVSEEVVLDELAASLETATKKFSKQTTQTRGSSATSRTNHFAKGGTRLAKRNEAKNVPHGRFSLFRTLKAAAPFQTVRRSAGSVELAVHLERDDIRKFQMRSHPAHIDVIVIDSSGSMAAGDRIRYAKGLVRSISHQTYKKRGHIALISVRNNQAEILHQPTRNTSSLMQSLKGLPTGGRTPLVDGFEKSLHLTADFMKHHRSAASEIMIITDGKDNSSAAVDQSVVLRMIRNMKTNIRVIDPSRVASGAEGFAKKIGARVSYPMRRVR